MKTITENNKVTSVAIAIEAVRPGAASCLSGSGSSLSPVAALRGTDVFGGAGAFGIVSERPTQAPVAEAAQTFRYALAANGAGLRRRPWANGDTTVATQHHRKMRAFRGLEPWRDPA